MRTLVFSLLTITLSAISLADMGRTQGSWAVSPSGAATYTVPLWLQQGPKGVQPSLAFNYNSMGGNGTMGVGWAVSGFSSIERCPQTLSEDGVDKPVLGTLEDRFCLDGNKLRITSAPLSSYGTTGAVYQTSIADFSRVTSVGSAGTGPQSFIVHTKGGMILEFGNTADSRLVVTGSTVYRWMLNKVSDRDGNSYAITYTTDNATGRVPLTVSWAPTAVGASTYQYQAGFNYSNKSNNRDWASARLGGATLVTKQRLDSVTIGYSATGSSYVTKRQYQLAYGTSPTTGLTRLTTITECAATTSVCLKPTAIAYQDGTAGVGTSGLTAVASAAGGANAAKTDFNGDGRTDIAYSDGTVWRVAFSTGSGFTAGVSTGISSSASPTIGRFVSAHQDGFLVNVSGTVQYTGYNGGTFTTTSTGTPWMANMVVTDYDGDGLQDLMWSSIVNNPNNTLTGTLFLRPNTTAGAATVPSFAASATTSMVFANLANGGGVVIVTTSKCPNERQCDLNGDSRADLQLVVANPQGCGPSGCTSTYTGYDLLGGTLLANATPSQLPTYFGMRFNDDRCTDTIRSGTSTLRVASCGDATFTNVTVPATPVAVMDWDGDKRTDLIVNASGVIGVYRSRGSTTTPFDSLLTTTIPYSSSCNYFAGDVDGDGLDELICAATTSPFAVSYYTHNGGGSAGSGAGSNVFATQVPDLATSITDGYGIAVSPFYVSTAQSNYVKGTNTALPLVDATDAMVVVGRMRVSDGIGGTYDLDYTYRGARRNTALGHGGVTGPGFGQRIDYVGENIGANASGTVSREPAMPDGQFAGFEAITVVDSRNGIKQSTTYEQLFPLVGMVKKSEAFQSDGTLISALNITNSIATLDASPNNTRYFTYISQISTDGYEVGGPLNGQLITSSLRTFGYSSFTYGNVTSDVTVITDKDSTSTPSQYNNTWTTAISRTYDSPLTTGSDWCVGFLTQQQIAQSSTAAGVAPVTRTVSFAADSSNTSKCRIKSKTTEPSSSQYKVVETYGFDSFGNVNAIQVVGRQPVGGGAFGDMPARSTSIDWGSTGQFPVSITDPVGSVRAYTHNMEDGTLKEAYDANSATSNVIKTSYSYDAFARQVKITRPDGTYTTSSYDDCVTAGCFSSTHKLSVTETDYDDLNVVITDRVTYKDAMDRVLVTRGRLLNGATWNGTYQWSEVQFDGLGRIYKQFMPCMTTSVTSSCRSSSVTNAYDLVGRLTQATRPRSQSDSTGQSTTYIYAGRTQTVTDALGKSSIRIINVDSSVRQIKDANSYAINYGYDAAGSVVSIVDSVPTTKLSSVTMNYGIRPFQVDATESALGHYTRTYNSLGELVSWTDGKGQSFSASYDALSRPLTRLEPNSLTSTSWEWGSNSAEVNRGQLRHVESTANGETYAENYAYDNRGRLQTKSIVIPGQGTFNYDYLYDSHKGWLDTLTYPQSTPGYRLALKYAYQNGQLQSVSDANAPTTVFWTGNSSNAWGQLTQQTTGNGIVTAQVFDTVTARLATIQSGTAGNPTSVQNLSYLYDLVGNVTQRQNNRLGLTETFYYGGPGDNLNRLQHSELSSGSSPSTNLALTYDGSGNILTKTQPTDDPLQTQSITWTTYNYPAQITSGSQTASFSYGPSRQRWRMIFDGGSGAETTYYIGGLMEKVTIGSTVNFRHAIVGGNAAVVAFYNRPSTGADALRYVLADHQGSSESLVDNGNGTVTNASFTAYGLRRNAVTWSGDPTNRSALDDISRQGYTFQTALGAMGLNHMNGRVQDAMTGRFLSPDPYITEPNYTQNYNRYAYVYNNPLTFTDPSGFGACFNVTINILPSLSTSATAPAMQDLEEIVVSATRIQPTVNVCFDDRQVVEPGGQRGNDGNNGNGGNDGTPEPSPLADPRDPNDPCDSKNTATKDLLDSCNAGSSTACGQLAGANLADLEWSLNEIAHLDPEFFEKFDGDFPKFTFTTDPAYPGDNGASGHTTVFGNVVLFSGYNNRMNLLDTVRHEMGHVDEGFWGRSQTHRENRNDPNGLGPRENAIWDKASEVSSGCKRN